MEVQTHPHLPQRRRRNRLPLFPHRLQVRFHLVHPPRAAGRPMGPRHRHPVHPLIPSHRQHLLAPQPQLHNHTTLRLQAPHSFQSPYARAVHVLVPNHGDLQVHQVPGVGAAVCVVDIER